MSGVSLHEEAANNDDQLISGRSLVSEVEIPSSKALPSRAGVRFSAEAAGMFEESIRPMIGALDGTLSSA